MINNAPRKLFYETKFKICKNTCIGLLKYMYEWKEECILDLLVLKWKGHWLWINFRYYPCASFENILVQFVFHE